METTQLVIPNILISSGKKHRVPNKPNSLSPTHLLTLTLSFIVLQTPDVLTDITKTSYDPFTATNSSNYTFPDICAISVKLGAFILMIHFGKAKVKVSFIMILTNLLHLIKSNGLKLSSKTVKVSFRNT